MKRLIIISIITPIVGLSQNHNDTAVYIGKNGEEIAVSDTINSVDDFFPPEVYVLKNSSNPYNGILYIDRGNYVDTLQIVSGKQEGVSKGYLRDKNGYILQHISYRDGVYNIYVDRFFSSIRKYNHALIVYKKNESEIKMIVYYKKGGVISLTKNENGLKTKYKFGGLPEFVSFIDQMTSEEFPLKTYCEITRVTYWLP